jgi:hypothetical protein
MLWDNTEMDFIYQQIGLEDDSLRETVSSLAYDILNELHGYADNHVVRMTSEAYDDERLSGAVEILKQNGIILYQKSEYEDKPYSHYSIAVTNRYKLDMLLAELDWLEKPEEEKNDNTAPFSDYVVYYDVNTGDMLFNGVHKRLKKTNKALFDALFLAFPNYVDRRKLLSILGTTKKDKSSKIILNEAITNLRKVCGVKRHVIQLRSEGGRLRNVEVHPLSAQAPPPSFLTD